MQRIVSICLAFLWSASALADDGVRPPTPDLNAPTYYVDDIKAAMLAHVKSNVDAVGVFRLKDSHTGEQLALKFVKIHDPVRRIDWSSGTPVVKPL